MTLYLPPTRCPVCRARPRLRVTGLLLQMIRVCRPHDQAVVLTVQCRCGQAIVEVRAADMAAAKLEAS